MQLVRLERPSRFNWPWPALTVGNFDGVHRAHQVLVETARTESARRGGTAVALTFDPHPARVIEPSRAPRALMTLAQKSEIMAALGVDVLAVLPFGAERAAQAPEDFVREVLRDVLGARTVVVGTSFRFGRGRAGDAALLSRVGAALGFGVVAVPPVERDGEPISSTRIRRELEGGRVEEAWALLGRCFFVDGLVVRGEGRGRKLGVPTANLEVVNETCPARGVYAGWCRLLDPGGGARWPAVVNVGRRPTFGEGDTTVEVHVLDRDLDLYGQRVRVEFAVRLRDERPFPGPEALIGQIRRDVARARPLLDEASGRKL
ncbi:MAG TPA: bifunctional riboflavin kinase/FAD synthetase [Vicinamibacteria bacterium]|nr:bifunctional riboflavin kinase/FAD synthetase [Vicinamibacteria bacterium]